MARSRAERIKLFRRRRARDVRCITMRAEVGERQIQELVRRGYLSEREQWDDKAVAFALDALLAHALRGP